MIVRTNTNPRRAFTLVELLVVLVVILILVSLLFLAGTSVTRRGQVQATQNVLITLERVLDVYMLERGAVPPYNPDSYIGTPGESNGLSSASGIPGSHPKRPDAAVFLNQAIGYGEVDSIIQSIPPDFVRSRQDGDEVIGVDAPSIVDAWAEPGWPEDPNNPSQRFPVQLQQVVYFVHPDNVIAQELFGRCRNNRPYFMSAGPDRTYGFVNEPYNDITQTSGSSNGTGELASDLVEKALSDNIYSVTVDPPSIPQSLDSNDAGLRTWN